MGISFGLDMLYQKLKRIHKMIPIFLLFPTAAGEEVFSFLFFKMFSGSRIFYR